MKAEMGIELWRTKYHTINGFKQFYRDWQPRDETYLPVLALHGSLTQSGMWLALAEAAGSIRMLCPDQRGFGLSEDPGNDSCAEFALDALALGQLLLSATWSWVIRLRVRSHLRSHTWLPDRSPRSC